MLLDESDRLQTRKERLSTAIKNCAGHVQARMAVKKGAASPIGSSKPPRLTALPQMPVDMNELSAAMSDGVVLQMVTEIEGMVSAEIENSEFVVTRRVHIRYSWERRARFNAHDNPA